MKITRKFTTAGQNVFESVQWARRSSRITNADGSVVFEMKDAEIPAAWSQLATDIVVSKYFRKAGVPQVDADGNPVRDAQGAPVTGPERSVRQVVHRLVGCWRHWGQKHGYFDSKKDAQAFYDELSYMLLNQMAAPNSPQWFNTGLNWAYGISGPAQGHWIADHRSGRSSLAKDAYTHPQPHACFIQSVRDDLVGTGGIMDLWVREARLFKYGSGTGTNFSALRGEDEPLSGGGKSSGLMSFLKIGDRAAGAIKSGGTTRRAAKMVCLDVDHPDIESFVNWKVREEVKVAALVEGMKHLGPEQRELAESLGLKLDYDFNGEAYYTVSGQNSNNSVRLTNDFLEAVEADGDWHLIRRTDGAVARTVKARDLWNRICFSAWRCADPGVQYDSTINEWHTCPASGRINASNPCSEYMFLDNTACNLASINLLKFHDPESRRFDVERYEHAIRLWTVVLEISVLMASFPSQEIADLSWRYRTLGLGYANLGALLMQAGVPYDSDEGRALCGALTAILTGRAYATSAEMAAEHGPFAGYESNREDMLRVVRNHRRAARGVARESDAYEALSIRPVPIDHAIFRMFRSNAGVASARVGIVNADEILDASVESWDRALHLGEKHGYRNAQTTVIAPTGTIGLLMDCDTTGVEPDFALTKFKKLAGGGYFKIANQSLRPALKALGYEPRQVDDILRHVMGALTVDVPLPDADGRLPAAGARGTFRQFLEAKGYRAEELLELENHLPKVFDLAFAFSAWSMPEHVLKGLGLDAAAAKADTSFNGLRALGLTRRQIDALCRVVCGTQTVEGAPHLRDEHLPVFDCANKCGPLSTRFIAPSGHIQMMAAAQPFISGAISKTINFPADATVDEIGAAYRLSWELGLKANALYRDGCKLSQPLNTKSDATDDDDVDEDAVEAALDEVTGEVAEAAHAIAAARSASSDLAEMELDDADEVPQQVERIVERIIERPMRRRLRDTRRSITHKFNVAGHEGYLVVGLYEDGKPGELFITMAKEGSTIGGLMDSLGTAISVALQYGVPLTSLVTKFAHQRFEPMGMTTNAEIPFAKSLVDYIFRWLGMRFIAGYREANAPARMTNSTDDDASVKEDRAWQDLTRPTDRSRNDIGKESGWGSLANDMAADRRMDPASRSLPSAPAKTDGRPPVGPTAGSPTGPATGPAVGPATGQASPGTASAAAARSTHTTVIAEQTSQERSIRGVLVTEQTTRIAAETSSLDTANAALMGDAPACGNCGAITVRNGVCYKCLNCGSQSGCS
ncbi:MAG: adenosylcobalamin-dependent ribonucleoside-diphosphate reductase [Phycisphaerales bacterium]|nr:adenosylcobalamin-dependent ribonucleoside-diphosphate reductase [Phycisphaerales bacterium]